MRQPTASHGPAVTPLFSENQLICAFVSYSTIYSSLLFSAQTPLHMASERGHIKVCQFLVARNADTEARSMYAVSEVAVIVLHLACPSHSLPAAMAVPPSKKRSKITEPMLLRISAAPLRQNKQRTHVNTNRIVFSFLSPRMMRGVRGKERAKYISMYETFCFERSLYNNLLKRFSGLYIGINTKTCASDCMLGPTSRGWALLERL